MTSPGYVQTSVVGNTAFTTWSPGSVTPYVKPGSDVIVHMIPAGTEAPPDAFNAQEIVQVIGPRVKRG